jgi:hypothetical protein
MKHPHHQDNSLNHFNLRLEENIVELKVQATNFEMAKKVYDLLKEIIDALCQIDKENRWLNAKAAVSQSNGSAPQTER